MGVTFSGKKCYEGVRFNVISVTRGWVGVQFPGKKCYVTLEWPLRPVCVLSVLMALHQVFSLSASFARLGPDHLVILLHGFLKVWPGSILAMQQLRAKTIDSYFHHCQVLIYTAASMGASLRE